jgi:membrane protein
MKRWLTLFGQAAKAWNADNVFKHSAAVSFYTLFSLAPVTIIAVTVAGVFLGRDVASRQLELQVTQLVGPASAEAIMSAAKASQAQPESPWATALGVGLVVFGATTVFAQLQDSMNSIWGVRAKPSKSGWVVLLLHRLVSFAMVLTLAFLLLVSLVLTTLLTSAASWLIGENPALLKVADLAGSFIVIGILFTLLFKVMPDVRLRWKDATLGAFVTAVLFTLGRYLIALYLGHSTVASIYGAAGSLVALLVWIYYSCAILFFGVEFIRAYRHAKRLGVTPKETAVQVREEFITTRGHARA